MTDAVEALRQNVEQETANELVRAERHGALAVGAVAAIVLVAERDPGLVERDQPVVRDGDAMGVSGQIGEHRLRARRRAALQYHDPLLFAERCQVRRKARRSLKAMWSPKNWRRAFGMRLLQVGRGNNRRNSFASTRDRQQEPCAGRDPALVHRARYRRRDIAIMWMCGWCVMAEPQRVEDGGDTDARTEMTGVGGDGEHGLGGNPEQ